MTVREKLEHILTEFGMFYQQAKMVMDIAIPKINGISDDYQIEWGSDWETYEDEMYNFLFSIVKPEALKWIEEHCPKAWFRENFID